MKINKFITYLFLLWKLDNSEMGVYRVAHVSDTCTPQMLPNTYTKSIQLFYLLL